MKTTNHTDITAEILEEFDRELRYWMTVDFDNDMAAAGLEPPIHPKHFLERALHTQREEIVKSLKEEIHKLEVGENVGIGEPNNDEREGMLAMRYYIANKLDTLLK